MVAIFELTVLYAETVIEGTEIKNKSWDMFMTIGRLENLDHSRIFQEVHALDITKKSKISSFVLDQYFE